MNSINAINKVINNAISKVRLFEPNSLIRERADLFVKIHIIPVNQLVRIENGMIIPVAYIIDLAVISHSVVRIKDYLEMHESDELSLGKRVGKAKNKDLLVTNYIDLIIRTLRFFNDYFICRHVLDHVAWAYDEIIGNSAVINLFKREFRDDREVDKALNELSKHIIASIMDFYNGVRMWVLNHELRRPSYTQYFIVNEILKKLSLNEHLTVVEANEDYFYLGLFKNVSLMNTLIKLS